MRGSPLHTLINGGTAARIQIEQVVDSASIPDEEPTDRTEQQLLLSRALAQIQVDFKTQTWQAFWRTAIDRIPTDVVATELDMQPAAVRQARSRIFRRLRQQLGDL